MTTLQTVILTIHTLIALLIIVLVLLQRGKGADAGAAFGAGASGTVFGARGSGSFFSRATALLATAFFATSLTLAYMSSQHSEAPQSLLETAPEAQQETAEPAETGNDVPNLPQLEDEPADEQAEQMPSLEDSEAEEDPQ